jgi:hypothetical protein
MAWMTPYELTTTGTVAHAKADVRITGCSTSLATEATAAVAGLTLSKGRMLHWAASIATDPPVNETYEGQSLAVSTTWQQKSELGVNASGEVDVTGNAGVTKAKVRWCSTRAGLVPSISGTACMFAWDTCPAVLLFRTEVLQHCTWRSHRFLQQLDTGPLVLVLRVCLRRCWQSLCVGLAVALIATTLQSHLRYVKTVHVEL